MMHNPSRRIPNRSRKTNQTRPGLLRSPMTLPTRRHPRIPTPLKSPTPPRPRIRLPPSP